MVAKKQGNSSTGGDKWSDSKYSVYIYKIKSK